MSELFDDEELLRLENGNLFSDKPVTVLGKTFSNDEERREYFREELRKKLPELKKLEGYPIGEDDDIINLSDPPYYTACPNPWLNDFVSEWEKEKESPELKKLRKDDFEVKDPYASDVSEGKNNPIYNAHSYHTKVPHPAIMRYILHYTQPGDIVLDGFAGTGMTGVAAQMCGNPDIDLKNKIENEFEKLEYKKPVWGARHAVLGDLSPVATHIAATYNNKFDFNSFKKKANKIIDEAENELGYLYKSIINGKEVDVNYYIWSETFICPECGTDINLWKSSVLDGGEKIQPSFKCPHCSALVSKDTLGKNLITVFDNSLNETLQQSKFEPVVVNYTSEKTRGECATGKYDFEILEKLKSFKIHNFLTHRMPTGSESRRNDNRGFTHTHHFFTERNLIILDYLHNKMKDDTYLLSLLTASMINISKMWKFKPDRKGGSLTGTLYIPSLFIEQNPFNVIRRKITSFSSINFIKNNYIITNTSSTTLLNIANDSVDYIFTDPPFGANLMYSQLNMISENILNVFTKNHEEAIEDVRNDKSLFDYQNIMQKCFAEYYRVLKPGHWITIEFSNTAASVWNSIQLGLNRVGFVIANVSSLDKQQGSFKAVTTPTAVKQDLVISCYKPSETFTKQFMIQDARTNTWSFVSEHLEHLPIPAVKDEKTTSVIERSPKVLYDRLITYFFMRGLPVPLDAADFQEGLRNRYIQEDGMIFTSAQLNQYHELKKKHNITGQLSLFVDIIESENDAIQWIKEKLTEKPLKYQDIQPDYRKAYTINRKGEVEVELKDVLEENFIQEADGSWRIPDMNEQKDRDALRTKALLKLWEDYCTQIETGKVKKLKDVRLEAVKAGFKDCYQKKDFKRIVTIGDKIPENLLTEDETLLNYYDIACSKV